MEAIFTSDMTVRLIQSSGNGDAMVVAAARVSTSGEGALKWRDEPAEASYGLIRYLLSHRHGTPFEHACLTFFVHAPMFLFWEWVRHRIGFSYNLESGRYKEFEPVFWIPRRERKMKPVENFKPAKPVFESVTEEQWYREVERSKKCATFCYEQYKEAIADGISREVSRAKLPSSIYYSGWVTCNPRSLMSFLSLRTHDPSAKFVSYPQAEIEEAARAIEDVFSKGWPLTYRAFVEAGRVAP